MLRSEVKDLTAWCDQVRCVQDALSKLKADLDAPNQAARLLLARLRSLKNLAIKA